VFDPSAITASTELTPEAIAQAASSVTELKMLIARVAGIGAPEQGWTRLLKVMAKVATSEWMEGELQVDFNGDDKGSTISFYAVLGVGIRERLFASHYVAVPIDEFQRAVLLNPEIIAPLRSHQGLNRLTLAAGTRVRNKDIPDFEVEEKAKGDGERITAPPPGDDPNENTRPTSPPDET
jgi:hypothetical protein